MSKLDGFGLAATGFGVIFVYGGIKGYSPLRAFTNLLTGRRPDENQSVTKLTADSSNAISSQSGITGGGGTPSQNQALAKMLTASYGWNTGQQWDALVQLWNRESGWSQYANNPASGAYGIPQSLPYSKMPKDAWPPDKGGKADPTAQINWGLQYIAGRYQNPVNALAHENQSGWY